MSVIVIVLPIIGHTEVLGMRLVYLDANVIALLYVHRKFVKSLLINPDCQFPSLDICRQILRLLIRLQFWLAYLIHARDFHGSLEPDGVWACFPIHTVDLRFACVHLIQDDSLPHILLNVVFSKLHFQVERLLIVKQAVPVDGDTPYFLSVE